MPTSGIDPKAHRYWTGPGWTDSLPYPETIEALVALAGFHVEKAGRFRRHLQKFLQKRDFLGLISYELDYAYDDDPSVLYHARQVKAFFEKLEPLALGIDKEAVAWAKFVECEERCRETNQILRSVRAGNFCFPRGVDEVIYLAQRKIAQILGPVPELKDLSVAFGPGATTSVKRRIACPRVKLGALPACSYELEPVLGAFLETLPAYADLHAVGYQPDGVIVEYVVHPGRLQFVAKNAKTYRAIISEPTVNGLYQQGFGRWIRRRLQKFGIDLSTQERNRALANQGSRSGALATRDLSSASDCNSYELPFELLPLDWAVALSYGRSGEVTYRGQTIKLEKFSSMGNAFTFELETLIFYGLAWAACKSLGLPTGWIAVFGDDIVVPTEAVSLLDRSLEACGFLVNPDKSFSDGPFRESCGEDFFLGTEIRPFYQKDLVSGMSLFSLHNFYKRYGYDRLAHEVEMRILPSLRLYGPDGYGDGHLIGDWTPKRKKKHLDAGWEGGIFQTYSFKTLKNFRANRGDAVLPAYSVYVRDPEGQDTADIDRHYVIPGKGMVKKISVYVLGV